MYWYPSENLTFNNIIPNTNGKWVRVSHTYTQSGITKAGSNGFLWGFSSLTAGKEIKYRNLKLEKGNTATDWTPAPEDIQSDLDDTKEQIKKTVKTITEEYYQSTSSTSETGGRWTATAPTWDANKFMFVRSKITYMDGTSDYTPTVNLSGAKGDKGDTGPRGPQGIQGIQGPKGSNGQSQWVHIRYSPNPTGSGMTTNPSSTTKYVGIAVTNSATAPAYPEFTWSKYVGEDGSRGPQGLPGQKGDDGTTTYTWIRYADTPTSGMSNFPDGKKYIGMAFNKTTQTESSNYSDYQWSLMPQNIEIGGRNLLRNSGEEVSNGNYNIASYDLTDEIKEGEEVTLTIWGSLAATKSYFSAYNSGGSVNVATLTNNGNGTYSRTFKWKIGSSTNTFLNVYAFTNAQTGVSTINKIKLEKGNVTTDWTPAPEDVALDVNKKTYNPVRYIRDWSNGSTANSGNHWYELMAIDEYGNNKALNRPVTSNGSASTNLPHLTNGVTSTGTYVSVGNSETAVYVQVDLGKIYYNIAEIKVWKYYNDGRTYHESKTEVSSDGVNWHPIYDYTVEGEYASTSEGKIIPNTIAKTHSILTGRGTKNVIDKKAEVERIKSEAYADGKVTAEERKRIADAEDKYRKALILSRASSGKLMNSDPNFSKNLNEFTVYNNAANGNVSVLYENLASSTGPSGVTRRLRITTTGTAAPTWGGIVPSPIFMSRANAEYVIRFTALLPKGRSFHYAQNAMGTGYTGEWLTSAKGTGKWEEYAYYYKCGSTGSFSSFGHLYVLGGATPTTTSPLIWYLDKYEGLDISNVTGNPSQEDVDGKASAEDLTDVSNDLNTSIGDLSNTVDGKVDKSLYEEFLEHNANIQEQLSISTANAQEDITKALARTATVEQKLGEGAADWIFTHTQIRMSDEGITLGEQGSGSYLQITNDQISFYNGSKEPVAFINGGMLNINHAIFVESIQISQFMFSSEVPGHLTLRYVGN